MSVGSDDTSQAGKLDFSTRRVATPVPTKLLTPTLPSSYEESVELLRRLLNKRMRVKITDGRCIVGVFVCTDKNANVILASCQEYSSPDQSTFR